MKKELKIEVARSVSRKVNLGNYETIDVFASAKAEVDYKDRERISEELHNFCLEEMRKSARAYLDERENAKNGFSKNLKEPKEEKLTDKDKEDRKEAEMQMAIDAKSEEKYGYLGKDENGNSKFEVVN